MSGSTVSVCYTWSKPDQDHARGLCTNILQLETPSNGNTKLPCYVCVRPEEPKRVGGCRQCGEFDTNDQLVRYTSQATGPQALPRRINFALDGSITGAVAQQLVEQDLPRVHNLGRGGKRYLYTPVLQPSSIKTSGVLKQLSTHSGLAGTAYTLGAQIQTAALSAEAAETLIDNDGSCVWGMGEYWTHVRGTVGPRKLLTTAWAMLTDNVVYNCQYVPPAGLGLGDYWELAPGSKPLAQVPIGDLNPVLQPGRIGVMTAQTGSSITGFSGAVRSEPTAWKWPEEAGDLYSLYPLVNSVSLLFPFWRGTGGVAAEFGRSGMNSVGTEFTVDGANSYKDGNFYDYISSLLGEPITTNYVRAGDAVWTTGQKQYYWSTGDPYDPAYYTTRCRTRWRHRRSMRTGRSVVGYRWNLFHWYTSDPTSVTIPAGNGYGTLLKLSFTSPVTNTGNLKFPLWTWCDVTRPGYQGPVLWGGPSLQVTSNRWPTGVTGECTVEPPTGWYLNHQITVTSSPPFVPGQGYPKTCLQFTRNDPVPDIEFGVSGCCNYVGIVTADPSWDSVWNGLLYSTCARRIATAPIQAMWNATVAEGTYSSGLVFWGYDQLNPVVDFKSEWVNWIDTTAAEDAAVQAQLGTVGRLPAGNATRYPFVDANTLAVYKVTKSLAHCDREAFDLKLIWARTEAYGVTFNGPKLVPSSYPATGSIYWD